VIARLLPPVARACSKNADALAAYEPAVRDVRVRLVQHARGGITTVVEHPAD
jgi:hypothetical protein